jgi:long-chain acyl-CoA synthetase
VPDGALGELIVRSPGLMLGYLGDPEATAEALRDGWLHTGDNARRDADGCYHLAGRRGLLINVAGHKVSPEEVEAILEEHHGVREAVVVPQPDARRGEVVKAIVVPEGAALTEQELRRFCRARLAGYKVPRSVEFRREPLPRSALGKVLRQRL